MTKVLQRKREERKKAKIVQKKAKIVRKKTEIVQKKTKVDYQGKNEKKRKLCENKQKLR